MRAISLRDQRWLCSVLSVGCLTLLAAAPDRKQAAKLIDAIANRNKPPRLVKTRDGKPPLFPAEYDWKEEERVKRAIRKVAESMTPEVWEVLLEKADDKRYALTLKQLNGPGDDECAVGHWTVGQICREIAGKQLSDTYRKHLPRAETRPIGLLVGPYLGDLVAWRKKRKDKALYELQIEVCEMALAELAKVKEKEYDEGSPTKAQALWRIKAQIQTLRKTKRPVFAEAESAAWYPSYDPDDAKRYREKLEGKK